MDVVEKIGMYGLVPVAAISDSKDAVALAKALCEGGLPVIEVTMRTESALDSIRKILEVYPDMLVGAGTVLSLDKCREAIAAGAKFIVSPSFNEEVVKYCVANDMPVLPGVTSPYEIDRALACGLKIMKFFPANVYGGVKGCASLYAPYKSLGIKFMPTGGVNEDNLGEYVSKPFIHAVGGSWLCATSDIDAGNFDKIRDITAKAVKILQGFEMVHAGLYCEDQQEADSVSAAFGDAFGFEVKKGNSSTFASKGLEIMTQGIGAKGHIAIACNNVDRAVFYLENKGYEIDYSTLKQKNGRSNAVYLKNQLGGYGIHLLQK